MAAAALAAAGCGGSGRPGLTAVEQNQLLGLIAQARAAAAAGDTAGAASALGELRTTVSGLRAAGALDPGRAGRIQSVAAQALGEARAAAKPGAAAGSPGAVQPPAPATTRPAATTVAPPAAQTTAPVPAPVIVDRGPPARDRAALAGQLDRIKRQIKAQVKVHGGHGGGGGGD